MSIIEAMYCMYVTLHIIIHNNISMFYDNLSWEKICFIILQMTELLQVNI